VQCVVDKAQRHEKSQLMSWLFLCAGEISFGLAAVTAAATKTTTTAAAAA
jgi:hypothetical protein